MGDREGGEIGAAVGVVRREIERLLDDASARSAVALAGAAAQRFNQDGVRGGGGPGRPLLMALDDALEDSLRRLDLAEAAVMQQQDRLLAYLSDQFGPSSESGSLDLSEGTSDSVEQASSAVSEVDTRPSTPRWLRHMRFSLAPHLVQNAAVVAWFALVALFVWIFLVSL